MPKNMNLEAGLWSRSRSRGAGAGARVIFAGAGAGAGAAKKTCGSGSNLSRCTLNKPYIFNLTPKIINYRSTLYTVMH